MPKYFLLFILAFFVPQPSFAKEQPPQLTFQERAAKGDAYSQFKLGFSYLLNARAEADRGPKETLETRVFTGYAEAARWFRKAAEQGFMPAQQHLGVSYYFGAGVPRDHVEAAKWWRKAAEQGVVEAQLRLAQLYTEGHLGTEYGKEAGKWYLKAAEQGSAQAAEALANLYFQGGFGIRRSHTESYFWRKAFLKLTRADETQDALLDRLSVELSERQMADAERRFKRWKPKPSRATLSARKVEDEMLCSLQSLPGVQGE